MPNWFSMAEDYWRQRNLDIEVDNSGTRWSLTVSKLGSPEVNVPVTFTNTNTPTITLTSNSNVAATNTNNDGDTTNQSGTNNNSNGRRRRRRREVRIPDNLVRIILDSAVKLK